VVEMLREADAYSFVSSTRYRLMRTQEWTPEVIERLCTEPGSTDWLGFSVRRVVNSDLLRRGFPRM